VVFWYVGKTFSFSILLFTKIFFSLLVDPPSNITTSGDTERKLKELKKILIVCPIFKFLPSLPQRIKAEIFTFLLCWIKTGSLPSTLPKETVLYVIHHLLKAPFHLSSYQVLLDASWNRPTWDSAICCQCGQVFHLLPTNGYPSKDLNALAPILCLNCNSTGVFFFSANLEYLTKFVHLCSSNPLCRQFHFPPHPRSVILSVSFYLRQIGIPLISIPSPTLSWKPGCDIHKLVHEAAQTLRTSVKYHHSLSVPKKFPTKWTQVGSLEYPKIMMLLWHSSPELPPGCTILHPFWPEWNKLFLSKACQYPYPNLLIRKSVVDHLLERNSSFHAKFLANLVQYFLETEQRQPNTAIHQTVLQSFNITPQHHVVVLYQGIINGLMFHKARKERVLL